MVDRAGPFLASRSLTALIVIALVASAFAGVFLVGKRAAASGDLIIDGGTGWMTYVIQDVDQLVDGNVVITNGELKIIDGSLSLVSNFDARYSVTVGSNGILTLDHGMLTTYPDQIRPWAQLQLIVEDGGEVVATNDSALEFPGAITLDDGAVMTLRDSTVTKLPDAIIPDFYVGHPDGVLEDSIDDGPTMVVTDSTLKLFDSTIDALPEGAPSASNLTLNGDSTLLSVNSYIGVDFVPGDWTVHNMLEVNDNSQSYLYGTYFEAYEGNPAERVPAYVVSSPGVDPAYPTATREPDDTTVGEDVGALELVDSWLYAVDNGQVMAMDTWDVGGLADGTLINSATLIAKYSVGSSYTTANAVGYCLDGVGSYTPTTILPATGDAPGIVATATLNPALIGNVGALRTMDLEFVNGGGDTVQFESLWVVFSVGGNVYVYRWLNATVADEYGVPVVADGDGTPISEVTFSAVFTGGTTLEGQEAFYYTSAGISAAPEADVLDYMGETAETFMTTKADGKAVIPYLTDISDDSSNSWFVGTYEFTGSAVIDAVTYSSAEAFSFTPYPAMESGDQHESLKVEIIGISVPSPDISKWLVVPYLTEDDELVTTLVIEDMSYYHAGDVIVASDGELTILDSQFLLVQDYANERTIYVDGYGVLRFENAVVTSELPIDIVVQGHGTLEVVNSEMDGISIYAREDATILLVDSTMTRGDITTSWNSLAKMEIYDCVLSASPVLSGSTLGSFTNTSVPSIEVEDDAVALIYRWIHVTIWDGNSKPLPGVDVFARFFVNQTFWATAVSDSSGVARLNSLGSILTASGSTFVGNYRVNATYWYDSVAYESDQEISVGVSPYTEPLGMNATYALLTISTALPDLEIDSMTGVFCTPESPLNEQEAMITAQVENTGVSVAYAVSVDFYDDDVLFESVVYSKVLPGTTANVTTPWIAGYPLDPDEHTIKVVIDQADEINEIDDAPAIGYCFVTVQNLPDLQVMVDYGVGTTPASPVVDSECVVYAKVYNDGTNTAYNVPVTFYNVSIDLVAPEFLIGTDTIETIVPGQLVTASVTWTPEDTGTQIISVLVNENRSIPESEFTDNNVSFEAQVYDYPDLQLTEFQFVSGLSTVAGGDSVVVRATIRNLEPAPVTNPIVGMYLAEVVGDPIMVTTVLGTFSEGMNVGVAEFTYLAPMVVDDTDIVIWLVANPSESYMEQSYDNNRVSGTLTVTDVRPDLYVADSGISIAYDGNQVTEQMFGRVVQITVEVENLGSRAAQDVSMIIGIDTSSITTYTIETVMITEVAADNMTLVTIDWMINLTTPDTYSIWADVDPNDVIDESNETNNIAAIDFVVEALEVSVGVFPESTEYETGGLIVVSVTVSYEDDETAVKELPDVMVALYDSSGIQIPNTVQGPLSTDASGALASTINIPEGLTSGQYTLGVIIQDETYHSEAFSISGEAGGGGIPLLIWIIVIAVIVAVVVGFTLYTYVYGLGKLVECGECGSFIPAASKRCPKCGVEFEAGTMKCSECGQWVPSSATECPNCGVKFVGEPEGEDLDYLDRMRAEYDSMASEYRELAKEELGKKFSEKRFEEWWKAQPTYVSFEDWLAKEEEKRKEGPVPCTVCGTLNPREATVCHKCGTIFAPAEETAAPEALPEGEAPEQPAQVPPRKPPEGGAAAAPKMVVRRPIDRKVVPKKIIRTPVDKDDQGES
ncbi:MAG: hypothetical protein OEM29_06300 [Thermoplasmata archaeon]|nr:hypothetical protein [Thermoplasmata archaeon]